jgi:hypothetical protein
MLREMEALAPRVRRHEPESREDRGRRPDRAVLGGSGQPLDEIGERRTRHGEEPGGATAELPGREIAKPHTCAQVGGQMRAIEVQGECRPGAPPLPALNAGAIKRAAIEGVEAHQPVADRVGDADEGHDIQEASDPGVRMQARRRRRRWQRAILRFVLREMTGRVGGVLRIHLQQELTFARHQLRDDAHGEKHQLSLFAGAAAPRAKHRNRRVSTHSAQARQGPCRRRCVAARSWRTSSPKIS